MRERVVLREEHAGADHRYLRAHLDDRGSLHLDGQDLGPRTRPVSNDGEYEWSRTIDAKHPPALVELLGGEPDSDVLELLESKYSGEASYELERLIREADIPSELHVWGG